VFSFVQVLHITFNSKSLITHRQDTMYTFIYTHKDLIVYGFLSLARGIKEKDIKRVGCKITACIKDRYIKK